jgi:hypothetical protein
VKPTTPFSAEVKNEWSDTAAPSKPNEAALHRNTRISVQTAYYIEMRSMLLVFTCVICPGSVYTCSTPS